MDFALQYTREQEEFRREVRSWLEENSKYPPELGKIPLEDGDMSREMWEWGRDFQRKMGAKGWLLPLWPREYGGGGLTPEQNIIIQEELKRIEYPEAYYGIGNLAMSAIYVYGTEEQKRRFVVPIARGEMACWQAFTEPEVGSDLASLKTKAVKDGDDFVITGQKMWIGDQEEPDYLWCPAVTDPDAPRHQNLGAFFFPATLPGITFHTQNIILNRRKRLIFLEGVRVSREYLIGEETQGWRVISTSLELEHGAAGVIQDKDTLLEDLIKYSKETKRNGKPLSEDPSVQQALAANYIESNILRLLGLRNYWMFNSRQQITFHGSQGSFLRKQYALNAAERILNTLGPYALIDDEEWSPLERRIELHQRSSLAGAHPGGTMEVQKLIMARRMGISRTRERAAPTHVST